MHLNGSSHRGEKDQAGPPIPPLAPPAATELKVTIGPEAKRMKFVINSDFMEGRVVQQRIMDAVDACHYSENDVFAIKLSLEEALINAIKHGNHLERSKLVRVEAGVSKDGIEIVIHDQGSGFRRCDVPDPTLDENLDKNCGRGILLIESYMDRVEWLDDGRCVRMYRKRENALAKS